MRMFDTVALVVPTEVLAAVEPQDKDRRSSGNLADFDAPKFLCWMEHVK